MAVAIKFHVRAISTGRGRRRFNVYGGLVVGMEQREIFELGVTPEPVPVRGRA
jgi:hypothetical protein